VLAVFGAGAKLYMATVASRLAERIPWAYADTTLAAVASQLRALGVPVKNVRERGRRARAGLRPDRGRGGHGMSTVTDVLQALTSHDVDGRNGSSCARRLSLNSARDTASGSAVLAACPAGWWRT